MMSTHWSHTLRLTAVLLLVGRASAAQDATLRYVEAERPSGTNPFAAVQNESGRRLMSLVHLGLEDLATLVGRDRGVELYQLKDDLKWSDGTPLTVEDVVYSLSTYTELQGTASWLHPEHNLRRVEAVDDRTVRLTWARWRWGVDDREFVKSLPIVPRHGCDADAAHRLRPGRALRTHCLGAGPYQVVGIEENRIYLTANPHYLGHPPSIRDIMVTVIGGVFHGPLLLADLADLVLDVQPWDLIQFRINSSTRVYPFDSGVMNGLAMNCSAGILRLREVRQAIVYAVNRQRMLDSNYLGQGAVMSGPFSQSSFCFNPSVQRREHDPLKASALLDNAGVLDLDGDGVREYDGEPVRLRFLADTGLSGADQLAVADIAQSLGHIGIGVELDYQDPSVYHERVFYEHDFDLTFASWPISTEFFDLFSLSGTDPGGSNISQYVNDEINGLLQDFHTTEDSSERVDICRRIHECLNEDVPYLFLWTRNRNAATRTDRLRNVSIGEKGVFSTITEWEMIENAPMSTGHPQHAPHAPPGSGDALTVLTPAKTAHALVYVPAGPFEMGSNVGRIKEEMFGRSVLEEPHDPLPAGGSAGRREHDSHIGTNIHNDEGPVHTATLDAFFIDKFEVTNKLYEAFVMAASGTPSKWASARESNAPQQPVQGVSWNDAEAYCGWAGLRLPTEAEWEKAARGTDGRRYPWGSETNFQLDFLRANFRVGRVSNFERLPFDLSLEFHPPRAEIAPVASHPSGVSPYGVHDMAGNVYEWVADWYGEDYYGVSPDSNPTGPTSGLYRVLRGGSWSSSTLESLRAARRAWNVPSYRTNDIGFRCAQDE